MSPIAIVALSIGVIALVIIIARSSRSRKTNGGRTTDSSYGDFSAGGDSSGDCGGDGGGGGD